MKINKKEFVKLDNKEHVLTSSSKSLKFYYYFTYSDDYPFTVSLIKDLKAQGFSWVGVSRNVHTVRKVIKRGEK